MKFNLDKTEVRLNTREPKDAAECVSDGVTFPLKKSNVHTFLLRAWMWIAWMCVLRGCGSDSSIAGGLQRFIACMPYPSEPFQGGGGKKGEANEGNSILLLPPPQNGPKHRGYAGLYNMLWNLYSTYLNTAIFTGGALKGFLKGMLISPVS